MSSESGPKFVTDGLVLCLDAANPRSYISGATVWNDLTYNVSGGTLTNGPTFSSANGGSIVFDGVDDYVDCTSLNVNYATTFTVTTWFKLSTLNRNNTVVGAGDGQVSPYYYWMITIPGNNFLQFWGYDGTNRNISYSYALTANLWYSATVTYDFGNCILYLNENNVASGTVLTLNNPNVNFTRLGYNTWAGGGVSGNLSGVISTTQVYNRVLSASEILQNYNATKSRFGL